MLNIVRTTRIQFGVLSEAHYFPPHGPHPLEDTFGMFAACIMLKHSLNPGIKETNVQFGTILKTRSTLTNYSNTTIAELLESVLVGGLKGTRFHFSRTPMYVLWFDWYIRTDAILGWETTYAQTRR